MAGYMTSAVVAANLDAMAARFPTLCTRSGSEWAPGWSGGTSGYVKVAADLDDSPADRWAVLITGGVHARELAPPDALVSFLANLLRAYDAQSEITYPGRCVTGQPAENRPGSKDTPSSAASVVVVAPAAAFSRACSTSSAVSFHRVDRSGDRFGGVALSWRCGGNGRGALSHAAQRVSARRTRRR